MSVWPHFAQLVIQWFSWCHKICSSFVSNNKLIYIWQAGAASELGVSSVWTWIGINHAHAFNVDLLLSDNKALLQNILSKSLQDLVNKKDFLLPKLMRNWLYFRKGGLYLWLVSVFKEGSVRLSAVHSRQLGSKMPERPLEDNPKSNYSKRFPFQ